jgi:hypothetical protein
MEDWSEAGRGLLRKGLILGFSDCGVTDGVLDAVSMELFFSVVVVEGSAALGCSLIRDSSPRLLQSEGEEDEDEEEDEDKKEGTLRRKTRNESTVCLS